MSSYLLPVPKDEELARLNRYIAELAMSFTGRVDTDGYNTFLQESVELLTNAIEVFCEGYFDAAFYLVRSSIEVSTVGVYFSDSHGKEKDERKTSWMNLDFFPVQKKLLARLQKEGSAFSEFREKVPAFFDMIDKCSNYANKIIHKQGYASFYCVRNHPLRREKFSVETLKNEFIDYMLKAIGAVATMRLAIDPFPVMLSDPECENRFAVSVTRPFSDELIEECVGKEIVKQYKTTEYYRTVKHWVIESFPVLSTAAYDVEQTGYIDIRRRDDLLNDIHLLGIYSACAIILTFSFRELCNVYTFGGIDWYFNNRYESIPSTSSTDLFNRVKRSETDNYRYTSRRICTGGDILKEQETYLTARSIAREEFVIETISPLTKDQINQLDNIAEELNEFYLNIQSGEWKGSDIKLTCAYAELLSRDDSLISK